MEEKLKEQEMKGLYSLLSNTQLFNIILSINTHSWFSNYEYLKSPTPMRHHSMYLEHLVLPPFGSPRWNECSLLLSVHHAPINLLLPLNYTNH